MDIEVLQDYFPLNPKESDMKSPSALGKFLNANIAQFLSQNFEKLQRIFTGQTNVRVADITATTINLGNYLFELDALGYLLISESGVKSMKLKNGNLYIKGEIITNNLDGELT